jgi:hypothetical protein
MFSTYLSAMAPRLAPRTDSDNFRDHAMLYTVESEKGLPNSELKMVLHLTTTAGQLECTNAGA